MLRFVVPLIALLTYGLAASIDECTFGESYWCSSLENAKTCGAYEHCKSTIWQNEILKPFSPLRIHSEPICTDCKKFFTDLKNLLLTNATEAKIEELVDLVLCRPFGSYEQLCRDLVKQYLPEILQLLFSDPNLVCQTLGCCAQTIPETRNFLKNLKLKKADSYAEGCNICKSILKDIQDLDRNQDTQTEIKDFLRQEVCDRLGNLKTSCDIFADVCGDKLFELLANELDPESRCRSLGFCSADNVIWDPVREATPSRGTASTQDAHVAASPQCIVCKIFLNELESILSPNASKEEINAAMEKVCYFFPFLMRDSCEDFIEQYANVIIDLLEQELHPSIICDILGLCASFERVAATEVEGGLECTVCETVVQYLEALVAENATMSALESALEKVCNFLPDKYKSECDYIVKTYGSFAITYITTEFTPKEICETVGTCSNAVKMAMITEAKEVKTSQKLLGESECTWGPKFWCTSKENAAKCQATDFCEETGWDF